jgi:hypothetical protein
MSAERPPLRPGRPDPWEALRTMDAPLRALFETIASADHPEHPDLPAIGAALVTLSHDHDYLAPRLVEGPGGISRIRLHVPTRGPRLQIVRRPRGGMSPVHDHGSWVVVCSIAGVETHRRYRVEGAGDDARLERIAHDAVHPHAHLTLMDPDDMHDHGHQEGTGDPSWLLVINGDDPGATTRQEWDLPTGTRRILRPGDGGRFLDSEPILGR